MRGLSQNSGAILIVVIWILIILTIFAVALGRGANAELTLVKYSLKKMQARYLAWGGFNYAILKIAQDSQSKDTQGFDNLFQCAVTLKDGQSPSDIFHKLKMKGGYFEVSYDGAHYGLSDEERKINLNALTPQNDSVFKELLMILGADERRARTIAASVVDWRDEDSDVTQTPFGEEGNNCKNRPFDHVEELLLVKGMTPELFLKVKDLVTVFPKNPPRLTVNFATASEEVLKALARSVSGPATNTQLEDADSLVKKAVAFRMGDDGREATSNDRGFNANKMGLNEKERVVFLMMTQYMVKASQYIRVHVEGTEEKSGIHSTINAVVYRENLSVVAWNRD